MSAPIDRDSVVEDEAPASDRITAYDERHYVTYLRLLDASAEDADWKEVARIVLRRDPDAEELRTYRCWQSHLARAEWMTKNGYKQMLRGATANKG